MRFIKDGIKDLHVLLLVLVVMLAGCGRKTAEIKKDPVTEDQSVLTVTADNRKPEESADQTQEAKDMELVMTIDGIEVSVVWEKNESVDAIRKLAASGGLEINMSMYGGFEQVGSIGQSIPKNDEQTAAKAGDIVLYSGNQIVVFYGSNSWAYTRLGRITDKTEQELAEMLGNGNTVLRFETGSER